MRENEKTIEFTTVLGTSEIPSSMSESDALRLQSRRFFKKVLQGDIDPTWDEFYFVLRAVKTDSITLAEKLRVPPSYFTMWRNTGKIDYQVLRLACIQILGDTGGVPVPESFVKAIMEQKDMPPEFDIPLDDLFA